MYYYDLLRERLLEFPFNKLRGVVPSSDITRYRSILEKSSKTFDEISFHNNTLNWVEIKSELFMLTETDLRYLFFTDLHAKLNEIHMILEYSIYNDIEKTYTNRPPIKEKFDAVHLSVHAVTLKEINPRCDIVIKDHSVHILFFNNWSEDMKKTLIMTLFPYSDNILCWNFNITVSINLNILKKYNILLFHLFLNGDNAKDIIVNEIVKEQTTKTKNYVRIYNLVNVITTKNDISIVKIKHLSVPAKYAFLKKWQDIMNEYHTQKVTLISYYDRFLVSPAKGKIKKTKKFLTELEERVPELFKTNIKGKQKYSQRCQKKKQPFIVDDVRDYTKNLTQLILDSGKYPIKKVSDIYDLGNEAIMAYINDPNNNLTHPNQLLKKFPDPPEEGISSFFYSCTPRDGNLDDEYKIIDTIQKEGYKTVPCCFIKSRENKNVGLSIIQGYELSGDKNLLAGRSGKLPFYLNEIFPLYKRYGVGSLKALILAIMNELNIQPHTLFDMYLSHFRIRDTKESPGVHIKKENIHTLKEKNHHIWKFRDAVIDVSPNVTLARHDIAKYTTTLDYMIDTIGDNFHYWGILLGVDFFNANLYVSNGIYFYYYNFDKDDKHIHDKAVYIYKNTDNVYEIIYNTEYVLTDKHELYHYLVESYTLYKNNIVYLK